MNVNVWDVTADIENLIRAQEPVDLARLADPGVALDDLTPAGTRQAARSAASNCRRGRSRRDRPPTTARRSTRRSIRWEAMVMGLNVAQKLIAAHLVDGEMVPGTEVGLRIDQTLTQDATGTMVMLELEALGLDRVRTEVSVQYVDHNLLQTDERNMADHLFLRSACQRFGLWYSKAGNGVSHPTHMQRFGIPGASMVGSDSHTCAAGSLGMLAIGVGGLEVAMAMAGEPLYVTMPQIWGIRLTGALPAWVSAKDVILEMLRRHGVNGGVNRIIEYHGPGLAGLSAMDRHVIANMGAELGATTTVFPADDQVRAFLRAQDREDDFVELRRRPRRRLRHHRHHRPVHLEPLIAAPSSPGNVAPVRQVAGTPVQQVVVGSSANPGLRDFAVVAAILRGRQAHPQVSLDVNPTSRQILADLTGIGRHARPDPLRGPHPPVRLHGLHRHGPGPRGRRQQPAHVPAQLPRPLRHHRRPRLAVLTGDRGRGRVDRPDHRPPRPARPARHRLPGAGPARRGPASTRPCWRRRCRPPRPDAVRLVKAPSIGSLPELDPLPDTLDAPVVDQGR